MTETLASPQTSTSRSSLGRTQFAIALQAMSGPPDAAARRRVPIAFFYRSVIVGTLTMADAAVIAICMAATLPPMAGHSWGFIFAVGALTVSLQCIGACVGCYDIGTAARLWRGGAMVLWLGLLATGLYLFGSINEITSAAGRRVAIDGAMAAAALCVLRFGIAACLERYAPMVVERTLLIGKSHAINRLLTVDSPAFAAQRFAGVIAIGEAPTVPISVLAVLDLARKDRESMIEDFWRIEAALQHGTGRVARAIILPEGLDETALAATLARLEHLSFEIALAPPPTAELGAAELSFEQRGLFVIRRSPFTPWGWLSKRALDIVGASLLLIILAPLLLVIAALIRHDSPGPALFRQTRWGCNNEPFTIFKFRTMWSDAQATDGSVQATRDDKRVTPLGKFLRNTSIDELPQLLNVLNGTMSLVGPRPHPVALNVQYMGLIPNYAARHRVVPGMTGLAQVLGFRGESRSPSVMQKRVELDLEYIRTRSFGADIRILLKTLSAVIRGANAY